MRNRCALSATLIAPFLMIASSNSLEAADESKFFLQDHGEVRVLRGLDPGQNFEAATLPEDIDLAPAAAPPELPVEPRPTRTEVGPKYTRQAALQRARERGITTHRAGVNEKRGPDSGRTRYEAIQRSRERGITTHRAGDLGWKPYSFRDDRLSTSSSLNR
jgi:hypothetical protein